MCMSAIASPTWGGYYVGYGGGGYGHHGHGHHHGHGGYYGHGKYFILKEHYTLKNIIIPKNQSNLNNILNICLGHGGYHHGGHGMH